MSPWVIGLGAAALYLFNKNTQLVSRLDQAVDEYYDVAKPATDGVTSAEIRGTQAQPDSFLTFGDMNAAVPKERQLELEARRAQAAEEVAQFDSPNCALPRIEGVMLQFDRSGV
tara:strand:- start:7423 stop:7764 length:342 start_codon:yes stop_codon:yes gene_type:complete